MLDVRHAQRCPDNLLSHTGNLQVNLKLTKNISDVPLVQHLHHHQPGSSMVPGAWVRKEGVVSWVHQNWRGSSVVMKRMRGKERQRSRGGGAGASGRMLQACSSLHNKKVETTLVFV